MKEVFKQIIADFQAREIPQPAHRDLAMPKLPSTVRKAIVLMGMRRVGKTWLLYQVMQDLLKAGVSRSQILYIDFSDDRLAEMTSKDWQSILDAYFELYPAVSHEGVHFFFDEVHEAPGWERFVRRLLDTEQFKLYLSGSSAKLLSKEIATELRGRCIAREIFPFSFAEYLGYKKVKAQKHPSSKERATIQHHLTHYLRQGGFPESLEASPEVHRELLQGYVDIVIYRDVMERYEVTNATALKRFLTHCLQNASSSLSINKLYNTFHSMGLSVSKNSLYDYLDYFEDAYCLFAVPAYELSDRKSSLKPKKVYPVDTGLVTAYTLKDRMEHGARFETAVFCHLRKAHPSIHYFTTSSGREVDFVVTEPDGTIALYQACVDFSDAQTRKRELIALEETMTALSVATGHVITLDHKEKIKVDAGLIHCIPAWEFFSPLLTQP